VRSKLQRPNTSRKSKIRLRRAVGDRKRKLKGKKGVPQRVRKLRNNLAKRKRKIQLRLEGRDVSAPRPPDGGPMFNTASIQYDLHERMGGIGCGGVPLMYQLAVHTGLVSAIDQQLHLLRIHLPYHESDHVLNFVINAFCGGTCLQDMELRRNDENFLDGLGVERIPDPTTAGDFCRRFRKRDLYHLMDAIDEARLNVWKEQGEDFFDQAVIDMDGSLVVTSGECKQGMDLTYKNSWGYHPLIVSLANTGEVLSLVNRSGNRPSHEGAAAEADRAIALCRKAGFRSIVLRGDTDFSQTQHLDRWDAQSDVRFIFGYDACPNLKKKAEELPAGDWQPLPRPAKWTVKTEPRQKPSNVKERIVQQRQLKNLVLEQEEVAEFSYRPGACKRDYRMVVLRKTIHKQNWPDENGQKRLFTEYRYHFYISNDRELTPQEVVSSANHRCDQENLVAQLSGGVKALHAPVQSLLSNWAYMLMTSLAWTLKAWAGLLLPLQGRWREKHLAERRELLRMDFRSFLNHFMRLPCQLVRQGRRTILRVLSWNAHLPVFFRLCAVMRC
jgi:hypothetical protein